MPRKRGRRGAGSITRLPSGKFLARWSGGLDGSGKRIRKSATFILRNDAEWWLRQAGRTGEAPDTGITVAEYLEAWLKGKRKIRQSTRDQYENHIREHLIPELGAIPVASLQRRHVEAFVDERLRHVSARTNKPLDPRTVGKILTTLRSALEAGVPRELPDNPAAKVEAPYAEKRLAPVVSSVDAARILGAVKGTWLEPIVRFLFGSGLRISEAVTLDQGDVDHEARTVRLRQSKTSIRLVRVSRDGMAALSLLDQPRKGKREPLFFSPRPNREGYRDRLSRSSVSHALPKLLRAQGLPALTAHGLRHAHATVGLERGTPIEAIAAQLGHRNPTMTRNVYAHVTARLEDEALDRLDEAIGPQIGQSDTADPVPAAR